MKMLKRNRRSGPGAAAAVALSVALMVTDTAPAFADTATVLQDAVTYQGPNTGQLRTGALRKGETVAVACTTRGERVAGPFGETNVWDYTHLENGYVSDAFLFTGQAEPVGPACGGAENHYDDPELPHLGVQQPGILKLYEEIAANAAWNPGLQDRKWSVDRVEEGSLHNEGRALDYRMNKYDPAEFQAGWALANYLKAHAQTFGVQEIIWNEKAWDVRNPHWGWTPYGQHCTTDRCRHNDHLHIGMNWAGAVMKTRHWEVIVDNERANNPAGTDVAYSDRWTQSDYVPDSNAQDYRVAKAAVSGDRFTFLFYLAPGEPTQKKIDAWWTSGPSRNNAVKISMYTQHDWQNVGNVYVDQRANGGKWNELGTFNFTSGWNKVHVSSYTHPIGGEHVIADAIRVRDPKVPATP